MSLPINPERRDSYKIFDQVANTYDFLNHFLSLGIDLWWRKQLRKELPNCKSLEILDLATGTADLALELAKDSRVKQVTGIDLSQEMLKIGETKRLRTPIGNKLSLHVGDGVQIPYPDNSFDVVTVAFGIRNFHSPLECLKNARRVLRPGGKILVLEFSLPKWSWLRVPYLFYFRKILPFLGGLFSGQKWAYRYLNTSVEAFPQGKEFISLMEEAGFSKTNYRPLTAQVACLYWGESHGG